MIRFIEQNVFFPEPYFAIGASINDVRILGKVGGPWHSDFSNTGSVNWIHTREWKRGSKSAQKFG